MVTASSPTRTHKRPLRDRAAGSARRISTILWAWNLLSKSSRSLGVAGLRLSARPAASSQLNPRRRMGFRERSHRPSRVSLEEATRGDSLTSEDSRGHPTRHQPNFIGCSDAKIASPAGHRTTGYRARRSPQCKAMQMDIAGAMETLTAERSKRFRALVVTVSTVDGAAMLRLSLLAGFKAALAPPR